MVKTHRFNGVVFDIVIEELDGWTDKTIYANTPTMVVNMQPQNTKKFLETVIHEALHCSYPAYSEEKIDQGAKDISRLIWRLGFRLK